MRPISTQDDKRMLASELLAVQAVKAFVVLRDRNAWHGTTSRMYKGQVSVTADLAAARIVAESWRQRGSKFVIREVPGLLLTGRGGEVVSLDFHPEKPFADWDLEGGSPFLRVGTPMRDLLRALSAAGAWLRPPNRHSIVQATEFETDLVTVGPRARFNDHESQAQGSQYLMGWTRVAAPSVSSRAAHRIEEAFIRLNGASAVDNGLDERRVALAAEREVWLRNWESKSAEREAVRARIAELREKSDEAASAEVPETSPDLQSPTKPPIRGLKVVVFPEASHDEFHMAAVLVARDANGVYKAYVKDIPGRAQPDPEIVAALVQAVEIANL